MKKKAMIVLGGALSLTLAPFTAGAYTAEKALNACAEAIASEISKDALSWKLDDDALTRERLNGMEVIHLDVRNAETEAVVARADCVVDSRARVKRIKKLPIDAADARERSLSAY